MILPSDPPVILLGSGGHAAVLLDACRLLGCRVLGFAGPQAQGSVLDGVDYLGDDDAVMKRDSDAVRLVNGIGSVGDSILRRSVFHRFSRLGFSFAAVIHPQAILAKDALLAEGVQIMAGVVVQTGATFGRNVIINTGAVIDHHCRIGDHVHVAPGAVLSGGVDIGEAAHVGTGATVIEGIKVGAGAMIAAGAVVVSPVAAGRRVRGVPAKPF